MTDPIAIERQRGQLQVAVDKAGNAHAAAREATWRAQTTAKLSETVLVQQAALNEADARTRLNAAEQELLRFERKYPATAEPQTLAELFA